MISMHFLQCDIPVTPEVPAGALRLPQWPGNKMAACLLHTYLLCLAKGGGWVPTGGLLMALLSLQTHLPQEALVC